MFIKTKVKYNEFFIHSIVSKTIIASAKIISYNRQSQVLTMEKIKGMSVADFFGDFTPPFIFSSIRTIIKQLIEHNIYFVDITGYNFMFNNKNNKVIILDFEHATFTNTFPKQHEQYLKKFLAGSNEWNDHFK